MKYVLIVGGTKSGTTSLYSYLSQHPAILTSNDKQTNFFLSDSYNQARNTGCSVQYSTGIEGYKSLFPSPKKNTSHYLEASPDYMYCVETCSRIAETLRNEELYIVFIHRCPVERFVSWYRFSKQIGIFNNRISLEEYFETNLKNMSSGCRRTHPAFQALESGCWRKYVDVYKELLPIDAKICELSFEELRSTPEKVMFELCSFLEIDCKQVEKMEPLVKNKTKTVRSDTLNRSFVLVAFYLRRFLNRYALVRTLLLRPMRFATSVYYRINYTDNKQSDLCDVTLSRIREYYNSNGY